MGHPRSLDTYGDILDLDDMIAFLDSSKNTIKRRLREAEAVDTYTHIPPPMLARHAGRMEWSKATVRAWLARVSSVEPAAALEPLSEHGRRRIAG